MDMSLFKKAIFGFELLAAIIGLINWRRVKNDYWKWFPFYLLLLPILETLTYWTPKSMINYINTFIIIPIEFLFFCWLFYKNSQQKK